MKPRSGTSAEIETFIERHLRPKVRTDGGDITVKEIDGESVTLIAQADCAVCPATDLCLAWWLEKELARGIGRPVSVRIEKKPPYFTRFPA